MKEKSEQRAQRENGLEREKDTRERKKKETESEDWGKINQDRELLRRRRNQRKMEGDGGRLLGHIKIRKMF